MIYELINELENCTHGKFNHVIDELHVNLDLGIYEDIKGEITFIPKYTSAVVPKSNIKDYEDE